MDYIAVKVSFPLPSVAGYDRADYDDLEKRITLQRYHPPYHPPVEICGEFKPIKTNAEPLHSRIFSFPESRHYVHNAASLLGPNPHRANRTPGKISSICTRLFSSPGRAGSA